MVNCAAIAQQCAAGVRLTVGLQSRKTGPITSGNHNCGRALTSDRSAQRTDDAAAAARDAGDPGRLGLARGHRRQRRAAGAHAQFRPAVGLLPARAAAHLRQGRRPARRTDGQFRGRPSQHRRRPRGDAGPAAHQRRDRERRDRAAAGAAEPDRAPEAERRHLSPHGPALAGRRAFASGSRGGACQNPRGAGVPTVVHVWTDGRDTPPQSAGEDVARFIKALPPSITVATVCGRYYAMDRDKRWERVAKAYAAMVDAEGPRFPDAARGDRRRLCGQEVRRVHHAGGDRRLRRHARRRRRALLQFPRRPRARNPRRHP